MRFLGLLFLLFLASKSFGTDPDYEQVAYGPDEDRQYMDIYLAPSDQPTPVYFDAHGNGGNINMPNSIVDALLEAGISIVSWESLTSVNTPEQVDTGWTDAELMISYVKANAVTYNFDTTNFIIGGSSRGSILSWKYGHSADPAVKGLYMYNALPDGVWNDPEWWYAPNEVTVNSPPIFFVYEFEPGTTDSHNPENGMIIMDKYDELGIGYRDTLVHSISYTDNDDKYQFLVEFALSVIDADSPLDDHLVKNREAQLAIYPNPFCNRLYIEGLSGNETIQLRNNSGQVLRIFGPTNFIDLTDLSSGLYLLDIHSDTYRKRHKIMKP